MKRSPYLVVERKYYAAESRRWSQYTMRYPHFSNNANGRSRIRASARAQRAASMDCWWLFWSDDDLTVVTYVYAHTWFTARELAIEALGTERLKWRSA